MGQACFSFCGREQLLLLLVLLGAFADEFVVSNCVVQALGTSLCDLTITHVGPHSGEEVVVTRAVGADGDYAPKDTVSLDYDIQQLIVQQMRTQGSYPYAVPFAVGSCTPPASGAPLQFNNSGMFLGNSSFRGIGVDETTPGGPGNYGTLCKLNNGKMAIGVSCSDDCSELQIAKPISNSKQMVNLKLAFKAGGESGVYTGDLMSGPVGTKVVLTGQAIPFLGNVSYPFMLIDGVKYYVPNDEFFKFPLTYYQITGNPVYLLDGLPHSYSPDVSGLEVTSMAYYRGRFCATIDFECRDGSAIVNRTMIVTNNLYGNLSEAYYVHPISASVYGLAIAVNTRNFTTKAVVRVEMKKLPPSVQLVGYTVYKEVGLVVIRGTNTGSVGAVVAVVSFSAGPDASVSYHINQGEFQLRYESKLVCKFCLGASCLTIAQAEFEVVPPTSVPLVTETSEHGWFIGVSKTNLAIQITMTVLSGLAVLVFLVFMVRWMMSRRKKNGGYTKAKKGAFSN